MEVKYDLYTGHRFDLELNFHLDKFWVVPEYWIEPWSAISPKNCVDRPVVNPDIFTFSNLSGLQFQIIR